AVEKDFAEPAWLLGASRWTALDENTVLVSPTTNGDASLALLRINSGEFKEIRSPYVNVGAVHGVTSRSAIFVGVTDDTPSALIKIELPESDVSATGSIDNAVFETLKATSSAAASISSALFPKHQSIALDIPGSGAPLHVMYFPPTNPDYSGGNDGERPPCVLNIHGGPTSRVAPGLSWTATYFTSRGWAWVDVNYGGSSGYGREYRERLRGNWGVVDVQDSVTAAEQLSAQGLIDGKRVAIRGGSAGGYTVLAAVVTHPLAFTVATSSYGISDLALLASDTHKFESRYLEKLIGGTLKEVPEVYRERSPVFHADKIRAPLLILQGSIDAVVPPDQAEAMVKQIKERHGKVEYIVFEGEGHGWRKAENIKRALEAEERCFGHTELPATRDRKIMAIPKRFATPKAQEDVKPLQKEVLFERTNLNTPRETKTECSTPSSSSLEGSDNESVDDSDRNEKTHSPITYPSSRQGPNSTNLSTPSRREPSTSQISVAHLSIEGRMTIQGPTSSTSSTSAPSSGSSSRSLGSSMTNPSEVEPVDDEFDLLGGDDVDEGPTHEIITAPLITRDAFVFGEGLVEAVPQYGVLGSILAV
ncbi:hypothetical protein FRB90_008056, partial [Tulasnella sp. 427]